MYTYIYVYIQQEVCYLNIPVNQTPLETTPTTMHAESEPKKKKKISAVIIKLEQM